jgi:hypothetical protein
VVYVDNDPLVFAHAQALLTSTPPGACDYIQADARDPGTILRSAARTLDMAQPVAIMMLGILNFVLDPGEARRSCAICLTACRPAASWSSRIPPPRWTPSR